MAPITNTTRGGALRIVLGVLLGSLLACERASHGVESPPDIVVVLIDTLRNDHLGTYGYERDTTPAIDSLAKSGTLFANAIAQSSWTMPSLASFFTSRYATNVVKPPNEGKMLFAFGDEAETFAEVLSEHGYETVSVATNVYNSERLNLMQGFDVRDLEIAESAEWVVDRAIEHVDKHLEPEVEGKHRPLLLYLHFLDMHIPRNPPERFANMFPTTDGLPHQRRHRNFRDFNDTEGLESEEFRHYRSHTIALYDGALSFVDAQIGRFLNHLKEAGAYENTVFIVTSDHGEALWDHTRLEKELGLHTFVKAGQFGTGHGHTLFPELLEVPLIFSGPGVPRARVAQQVRLIDVGPTLLALARVAPDEFQTHGIDLLPLVANGTLKDLPAQSATRTTAVQFSLQDAEYQYLRIDDRELLFERSSDDLRDVSSEHPKVRERLSEDLDGVLARGLEVPTKEIEVSEFVERLRQLGYLAK